MTIDPTRFGMWIGYCLTNAAIASLVAHVVIDMSFVETWALAIAAQVVITGLLVLDRISDA